MDTTNLQYLAVGAARIQPIYGPQGFVFGVHTGLIVESPPLETGGDSAVVKAPRLSVVSGLMEELMEELVAHADADDENNDDAE